MDSTAKEGFDLVLINEDVEVVFKRLEGYLYNSAKDEKLTNDLPEVEEPADEVDATMLDAPTSFPTEESPQQETTQDAEVSEKTAATENVEEVKPTIS